MTEYRYIGKTPDTLANGRPVAPGEFVELSDEEIKTNQGLFEEGRLLEVKKAGRRSSAKAEGEEE